MFFDYIFIISTADHGYYPRCVNDSSLVSSVDRSAGRQRCNPDRKIPVMNGERRPRPRRLLQYTSYTYIIYVLYYYYILYTLTYHTRRREGQRGDGEVCVSKDDGEKKKKKKRFAPIRRDGRLPEHRRLITRSVYVYACTTRSETRLINHSSPGRTEAMDLHNCVHAHTQHTNNPQWDLWLLMN